MNMTKKKLTQTQKTERLTKLSKLLEEGYSTSEIAGHLGVSERHLRTLKKELDAQKTVLPPAPKKRKKNDFTGIDISFGLKELHAELYPYQQSFFDKLSDRNIKTQILEKARQIGGTWTSSWWMLADALQTGNSKMLLSASKKQTRVNWTYVKSAAKKFFEVELQGQDECEITLPDGTSKVVLYFVSTNSFTGQGRSGDMIIDEAGWINNVDEVVQHLKPMTTLKDYKTIIMSTPSNISHPAYPIMKGLDSDGNPIHNERTNIQQITIHDALKGGLEILGGLAQLKKDYPSERAFKSIYECWWADDAGCLFKHNELMHCAYKQGKENTELPDFDLKDGPCVLGIDPNGEGQSERADHAGLVVAQYMPDKVRIVYAKSFPKCSIKELFSQVQKLANRYEVMRISCDVMGAGVGLWDRIKDEQFARPVALQPIQAYNEYIINDLVNFVLNLVENRTIQLDGTDKKLLHSFFAIEHSITQTRKSTYKTTRKMGIGHADVFWALASAVKGYVPQVYGHHQGTHTGFNSAPKQQAFL